MAELVASSTPLLRFANGMCFSYRADSIFLYWGYICNADEKTLLHISLSRKQVIKYPDFGVNLKTEVSKIQREDILYYLT